MCGRYTGNIDDTDEMSVIYKWTEEHYPSTELKSGEIFPTDTAPILFGRDLLGVPARWGYPSFTGKGVLINARAETAAEKTAFRDSLLLRRCVIPTTGYLEWDSEHTKYKINRQGEKMLYLGGFCKRFEDGARFVILTTVPNGSVSRIHGRMPLVLGSDSDFLRRWNEDTEWALNYLRSDMPMLSTSVV